MAHEITERRLLSQNLNSGAATPAEVVRSRFALQAQDYASALWAVGLRSPGSTRATVEQAVADRAIVRTWPTRGTLHFIAPTEVRAELVGK